MTEKLTTDFSEVKPWYLSRGIVGPLVSMILGLVGAYLGIEFSPEDTEQITLALIGGGTAVFSLIGLVGRIKAKTKVTLTKEKPNA